MRAFLRSQLATEFQTASTIYKCHCYSHHIPPTYSYLSTILWEAYGVAIFVSVICVVVGVYMLWDNGVDADMSYRGIEEAD
jgi:hypothetical protein